MYILYKKLNFIFGGYKKILERSALSGAFLHCFILFICCFYICIAFLLIFLPLQEYYFALTPPSLGFCLTPLFSLWSVVFLENWNFEFFDFLGYFKFLIFLEVNNTTTFF